MQKTIIIQKEKDTGKINDVLQLYKEGKGVIKMANNTENKGTRKGEVAPPSISTEDMIYMQFFIQEEIVKLLTKESRMGGERALLAAIRLQEERRYLRQLRFFCKYKMQRGQG